MSKHREAYPAEFRARMVALVRAGRRPVELAREFEPTAQSILNWVAQADRDSAGGRQRALSPAEQRKLARLRRRLRQLEIERDILARAAAWLAREAEAVPPRGRDS